MGEQVIIFPLVLAGFVLASLAPLLHRLLKGRVGWFIALLPLTIFVVFALQLPAVGKGETFSESIQWVPALNVNLTFYVDGLAMLMTLLVSGIGAMIMVYAGGYLHGDPNLGRFYTIMLIFMSAMLGLVLANNIFTLFIMWELTSISSFMLIGYKHEDPSSRRSAQMALLVTGAGGLAMLAGLILLGNTAGSFELSQIILAGDAVKASPLYGTILGLVLVGAFTKSAQFPFHFWLPNAMAAPTPVSAYLHSATMVKAGVYLLARLSPVLGGTESWFVIVTVVGLFTAVLGAWLSWQQTDLKRIMAYSTISALGTLVMLLGLHEEVAQKTAVLFLLVHSLYKGALFMIAGAIDHETGTRDVRKLAGMWRSMPFTFVAVLLATTSMSGLPPLLGFISKELMYEATLELHGLWMPIVTTFTVLTNVMMVGAAAIILIGPFFGKETEETAHPHHAAPISMWLGPVILGLLALGFGLFSTSTLVTKWLIQPAAIAVQGAEFEVKLGLWHGFTLMLLLSGITIAAGLVLWWLHQRLRPRVTAWDTAVSPRVGPESLYDRGLDGLLDGADRITMFIQDGYLRHYLLWIMGTLLIVVGGTMIRNRPSLMPELNLGIGPNDIILVGVIIAATLMLLTTKSRLAAVAALGIIGYGMALIFILYGAPDLAMTQFSIETLTVILFVLVLFRLPAFDAISKVSARWRDGIVAIAFGTLMGGLVLAANAVPNITHVTDFYAGASYDLAKGQNIVNVILVDFRALDTMVEVTVLSVAAIGVYALIQTSKKRKQKTAEASASGETNQ